MPTSIPSRPGAAEVSHADPERDAIGAIWDPGVVVAIAIGLCTLAAPFDPDTLWPVPALIGP